MPRANLPGISYEGNQQLKYLQSRYPESRFLLACKSCYCLKPPVVVEIGAASECPWCFGKNNAVLLFETKKKENAEYVEYSSIRERRSTHEFANSQCRDNLGLKWNSCRNGDDCTFAHSEIELETWRLRTKFSIEWIHFNAFFNPNQSKSVNRKHNTLKGVFHCFVCCKNLPSGKEFSSHCDSPSHKRLIASYGDDVKWKYRPLPDDDSGSFTLCESSGSRRCRYYTSCRNAHSEEELEEWKKRFDLQNEKMAIAIQSGLISFADRVLQEYEQSSSSAEILQRSLPGVDITLNHKRKQTIPFESKRFTWKLKMNCADPKMKLNHAAFLPSVSESSFSICRLRGGQRSEPKSHIDFTVALNEDYLHNLHDGEVVYEVVCNVETYGFHQGRLVFEFRHFPRPVLLVEFTVEVVGSMKEVIERPAHEELEAVSWERDRRIIRWEDEASTEFGDVLKELLNKYKAPDAALDYVNGETSSDMFPMSLQAKNYVKDMHNFLFKEEHARTKKLAGPRPFLIALSENYVSAKKGICFNTPGELFAVFEVPNSLNRDTDEGFLILESCSKVLIGRKNFPDLPVYEVMIEEKFVDHIIVRFSKACVEDWQLKTGVVVEVEIQFQLSRETFCRCHCALDQLEQRKLLPLVCPNPKQSSQTFNNNHSDVGSSGLDLDQKSVWAFITSTPGFTQNSILPLFLAQGSFGTGKTYTISRCILHLLESDPEAKVLICTHSNSAADRYIDTNFQNDEEWKGKVVRVLYHGRRPETVSLLVKKYCLWRADGQGFRYPTFQDVARCKVFITTFETSLALGIKGTGLMGAFTHIFLDEAAQAMEAETIIPLTLADSTKTKIVVAGDHKQIAQKIYSNPGSDDSVFTLLTRIFNLYFYDQRMFQNNFVVLRNNYRCVESILKLIESLFYANNFLVHCSLQRPLLGLKPIQFHNVEGQCVQDPFTSDYFNEAEALQIAEIVKVLLASYPLYLDQKDIVVVSSYTHQVRYMRSCLRSKRLGGVLVDRVRNIQGLEYKVVILSCVHRRRDKSDKDGENFGLLSDANLLNTAFTRSMLAVIAVGHAATLWSLGKCSIMWHKYLRACEEQGSLFPYSATIQAIRKDAATLSRLNPDAREFVPFIPGAPKVVPAAKPKQQEVPSQISASNEEEDSSPHPSDDEESDSEALPLKDEILNQIIQRDTGSKIEEMRVKVDPHGREFVERMDDRPDETQNTMHCDFSLPQLKKLLRDKPDKYKRCILDITSWNSANAIVLEPNPDIRNIVIKTKRALGRSFDKDEVVVCIASEDEGASQDDDNPEVYGRVIGVLQRYNDLSVKKFVCVPDHVSPGLMVPVDRRVTKFIILGSKGIKEPKSKIPICQLKGNDVRRVKMVDYDKHSISPYRSHFVVRYVKWLPNFHYPFGYVSEEIEPKNIEKYYSVVHDVPDVVHKPSIEKKAKELSKAKLRSDRRLDLTKLFVFTIDPLRSKDLDDALNLETCDTHKKCYKIGVHIADVASALPAGSPVDIEAKKRATTFYSGVQSSNLPRKIAPMLPSSLSTDKCSLLPDDKSRPAISIFIHSSHLPDILSPSNGNTVSNLPEPVLTMIRSRRQLSYKDAEDSLRWARRNGFERVSTATESNLSDQLHIIWQTMIALRWRRLDGASFSERPGFNELNRFFEETTAHMLIEEAMITYNACISRFLDSKACTFVMRTQEAPVPEEARMWGEESSSFIARSLNLQSSLLRVCNLDKARHIIQQPSIQTPLPIIPVVWEQIDQAIQRNDLESALVLFCSDVIQPAALPGFSGFLGIQKRAKLLTNVDVKKCFVSSDVTHFSLRLPVYSHCSSPIRRYTDIMAQRLVLLKYQQRQQASQSNPNVITLEHVGQSGDPAYLQTLSKKIEKRMEDAKRYEKDTQNVSFARNLSQKQCYEQATVVEESERDVRLHLLTLKDLPASCCRLKFRELNLLKQEQTTVTWRIRFFDVKAEGESTSGVSHKQLVSTVVSTRKWIDLLHYIRVAFGRRSVDGETMKSKFQSVLNTRCGFGGCSRQRGDGPCDSEVCRKSKCKDVLVCPSKLGIYHYRRITMSLSLGTPLCVQLCCGVEKGISTALIQLLSVEQDLDICLAHTRSPIEIFAADVTPKRGVNFRDETEYIDHWKPLFRMEAIHNAIKDGENNITLKNVAVDFHIRDDRQCGAFSLEALFTAERLISISKNDFLCIRIKNLNVKNFHGDEGETSLPEGNSASGSCFTWVAHAVVTYSSKEKVDDIEPNKYEFEICAQQVTGTKYPRMITQGERLATVEVLKLGISDRFIIDALEKVDQENNILCNKEEVRSLCLDQGLSRHPNQLQLEEPCEIPVGDDIVQGMKYQLNEGQIRQIKLALGRSVSMIQGPPGTGKSFVGAHLAHYFLQLNKKKMRKPGKVLYCGPSNKSVDVLGQYLLRSKLRVLRVYGISYEEQDYPNPLKPVLPKKQTEKQPDPSIARISLHRKIRKPGNEHANEIVELDHRFKNNKKIQEDESLFKLYMRQKMLIRKAKRLQVEEHDVIICTCATAAMLNFHLDSDGVDDIEFTQCIIDECGMCSEPETLAPIVASKAKQIISQRTVRLVTIFDSASVWPGFESLAGHTKDLKMIVLIGDHMQLQPIIMCRQAGQFGLGVSMFERLKEHAGMLTTQYRMHPGICGFPSEQFYDGQLETDGSVIQREENRSFRFCYPPDQPDNTAVFCHIAGLEKINFSLERGGENSQYNEDEAKAVIKILVYLHLTEGVPLSKIMILSPYTAQVNTIRELIVKERSHLKEVHVGTVITSQGSENDYVILSTVRSKPQNAIEDEANLHWRRKNIGFVTDAHQVNVAITRAKSGLCIVGNRNLLIKDTETWKPLLDYYEERGSIVYYYSPNAPWNMRYN